jgi:hypothetical protein
MIDHNDEKVFAFRKMFRDKYNSEPSDISYQGYDAFVVANMFFENSNAMIPENDKTLKGIYSEYRFERKDSLQCYENKIIHVYQPTKEGYNDLTKNVKMNLND